MKEETCEQFFSWLFDKKVKMFSERDISTLEDIYYPEEIKRVIDADQMQRLKKIMQLSTIIIDNPSAYHTRYDHSIGTYNNGVKVYLNQLENPNWIEEHSSKEEKLQIIASLLELLTHDIGHLTFSHTLESIIGYHGAHEIITDRILSEELKDILEAINPDLPEVMLQRRNHKFATLKEGNIDLDRMDYLLHDYIYLNGENHELEDISAHILEHISLERINGENLVPVFDNEIIPELQKFLELRVDQYQKFYNSNYRAMSDNTCRCFGEILVKSEEPSAKRFVEYLKECMRKGTNLDLSTHTSWNDIHTLNSFLDIIEKSEDQDLVDVAQICTPDLMGLINLVYKMVDFPEEVDKDDCDLKQLIPDEEERKLYLTVKKYVKGENLTPREKIIREELMLKSKTKKSISMYEFSEEGLENVKKQMEHLNLPEDLLDKIIWQKKIKIYSPQNINFAKTADGKIVELINHPNFSLDTTPIFIRGGFLNQALLREYGVSQENINQLANIFEMNGVKLDNSKKKNYIVPRVSETEDIEYKRINSSEER